MSSTKSTAVITTTTTVYAACQTPNLLGARLNNGDYIENVYISPVAAVEVLSPIYSAYRCCVACITDPKGCTGSAWGQGGPGQPYDTCTLNFGIGHKCPGQGAGYGYELEIDTYAVDSEGDGNLIVSNGYCGDFKLDYEYVPSS